MRKIYKIIGGMLITGTLVAGIGSGVAFAEYSTFEYGGETVLDGSSHFSKTVEYKLAKKNTDIAQTEETEEPEAAGDKIAEQKQVLNINMDYYLYTVTEDSSVPKNIVRFTVSYLTDETDVEPKVIENGSEETNGERYIYLDCDYEYNDFRDIMRAKNLILSDLKNHKISDYQVDRVEEIEISINPKADFTININGMPYDE